MSNKTHEIRPNQSIELLKELHILTRHASSRVKLTVRYAVRV